MARRQRQRKSTVTTAESSSDDKKTKKSQVKSEETRRTKGPLKRNRKSVEAPAASTTTTSTGFFGRSKPVKRQHRKRGPVYREEIIEQKWNDWKEIYLVGTEWYAYDSVYEVDWDFDHLEKKLLLADEEEEEDEDEDEQVDGEAKDGQPANKKAKKDESEANNTRKNKNGDDDDDKKKKKKSDQVEDELGITGKNVFVFGSTEPQMVEGTLRHIPVLIVVVGSVPPPSQIGINSVQMEQEEILNMNEMKMSWAPYIPKSLRGKVLTLKNQPNIYFLHCNQRRSALKRMKDEEVRKYEYALPYFIRPSKFLDDIGNETEVNFVYAPDKKRAMNLSFDWEMDDREDWIKETCENNDLDYEKYKDMLMAELKNQVLGAKKAIKEKREERQAILDKIPDEEKKALDEMKFYKFYPQKPDVSQFQSSYINRYYGHATKTFP